MLKMKRLPEALKMAADAIEGLYKELERGVLRLKRQA
jgi:hypothetical protein